VIHPPIDTNVLLRFLESPDSVALKFRGVFSFFPRVECGEVEVFLPDLVLFEAFFTLTSYYEVPAPLAAEKLGDFVEFVGIRMADKATIRLCLDKLCQSNIDLVDAYILAFCELHGVEEAYSFDQDLAKHGLRLLNAE